MLWCVRCVVVLCVLLVVYGVVYGVVCVVCVCVCGVVRLGMRNTPPCVDSKRLRVCVEDASHFRPPWRLVARDLLPLPLPEVLQISEDAHLLSRPVRQRLLRRHTMDLRVAETVQALNFLDGHAARTTLLV